MSRLYNQAFDWTVERRGTTLLLILLLSGVAILGYVDPQRLWSLFERPVVQQAEEIDAETSAADSGVRDRKLPPDVEAVNLSGADLILVVDTDDFFNKSSSQGLRKVVEALEALDYVESVFWMENAPPLNLFGLREPIFPKPTASPRQFDAARERAQRHPLIGGQLLSKDGHTTLLMITINWLFVTGDDDLMVNLKQTARQAAADIPDANLSFVLTGHVPIYLTFRLANQTNRAKYQVIGYGMILLMAVILFRGIRAVLIVSLAPLLGVFWSLGMIRYLNYQDNPFNDVVLPVMLSLVGLTDGVHLMVEIRRQLSQGLSPRDAARTGIHKVGLACALTSLTTAIGFGSLSLAHHEVVRQFGYSCVVGVLLTYLAVILSIPLASSTWLGKNLHRGHEKGLIDRNLLRVGGLVDLVLRWPRFVGFAGIFLTLLLIGISLTLRPDEKQITSLPMGSEAARALVHMDRAFGGLERGQVNITWTEQFDDETDPEILQVIHEVTELLESEPLLGSPISLSKLIDALPGEGELVDRVSLMDLLPPPLKRAFFTPETRQARVEFRVQDLGIARYGTVFEQVLTGLSEIESRHPEFRFELTGGAVWRWENLYQIVVDLAASLGSASIIILIVLAIAYRSLRLGLISVIPNLFPLAVTGATLALMGQTLEIVSVCAFTVCLGIAVDDTIHFLTRFREERRQAELHSAIRKAFIGTGTALMMTTVVLNVGFATVLFSDMRDQRIFCAMAGLTISAALFGDLIFLPALLDLFGEPRSRRRSAARSGNSEEPDMSSSLNESLDSDAAHSPPAAIEGFNAAIDRKRE